MSYDPGKFEPAELAAFVSSLGFPSEIAAAKPTVRRPRATAPPPGHCPLSHPRIAQS